MSEGMDARVYVGKSRLAEASKTKSFTNIRYNEKNVHQNRV
jgi:hypothetical protein